MMSEAIENKANWTEELSAEISKELVVVETLEVIQNQSQRKKYASVRATCKRLINKIDTERKRINKEQKEHTNLLAEDLTQVIEPTYNLYDRAIETYDKVIAEEQQKELEAREKEEAEKFKGRLGRLTELVSDSELQFIDYKNMSDEMFESFVEYRSSIEVKQVIKTKEVVDEPTSEPITTIEPEKVVEVATKSVEIVPLTDDDEIGQFAKYQLMLAKIKKPALIKSESAIALRGMIDDLEEALTLAIGE